MTVVRRALSNGMCFLSCFAKRRVMRRVLPADLIFAMSALSLAATTSSADTLDRLHVSDLIKTTVQEVGQPFPGVHIEIVDPADHLAGNTETGEGTFDLLSLHKHIDRQTTMPMGLYESVTISRHAAFAFYNREMAASLHVLPDRSVLCMVLPFAAPVGLGELAARLSGIDGAEAIGERDVNAADFYRFLLYHEVAHCNENPLRAPTRRLAPYDIYLAESRADAFAVLMHMRRSGNQSLPRFIVSARRSGMKIRGDYVHHTAAVVEPTIAFAAKRYLTGFFDGASLKELMRASQALTRRFALSRADFDAERRGEVPRHDLLP